MTPDIYLIGVAFVILLFFVIFGGGKIGVIVASLLGVIALCVYFGIALEVLLSIVFFLIVFSCAGKSVK